MIIVDDTIFLRDHVAKTTINAQIAQLPPLLPLLVMRRIQIINKLCPESSKTNGSYKTQDVVTRITLLQLYYITTLTFTFAFV